MCRPRPPGGAKGRWNPGRFPDCRSHSRGARARFRLDRVESRDVGHSQADSRETRGRLWRRGGSSNGLCCNTATGLANRKARQYREMRTPVKPPIATMQHRMPALPSPGMASTSAYNRRALLGLQSGFTSGNLGVAGGGRTSRLQAGDVRRPRRGRPSCRRSGTRTTRTTTTIRSKRCRRGPMPTCRPTLPKTPSRRRPSG